MGSWFPNSSHSTGSRTKMIKRSLGTYVSLCHCCWRRLAVVQPSKTVVVPFDLGGWWILHRWLWATFKDIQGPDWLPPLRLRRKLRIFIVRLQLISLIGNGTFNLGNASSAYFKFVCFSLQNEKKTDQTPPATLYTGNLLWPQFGK
jgi:hypothetical protein